MSFKEYIYLVQFFSLL